MFGSFRIGGSSLIPSLVDSTTTEPGTACEVRVFARVAEGAGVKRIDWEAREINTRFNLGGAGTAETTFTPELLAGADRESGAGRSAREVRFLTTAPPPDQLSPAPEPPLTLTITDAGGVTTTGRATVRALTSPATPFTAPATGSTSTTVAGFRSWLCTDTGWAALESPGSQARINPARVTQSAILGVVEIDRLIGLLRGETTPSDGLRIRVQALRSGGCSLALAEAAAGPVQLSLRIDDPMATVVTPRSFYREPVPKDVEHPGNLPQAVLPTLTCASGLEGEVAEEARNQLLQKLDEELSGRFESATFVSANVLFEEAEPNRPLSATLDFAGQGEGRLQFPVEELRLWHRPSQAPLARNFPWPISQEVRSFLDANRGLLPFRPAGQVSLRFPAAGLPRAVPPPDLAKIVAGTDAWELDPLGRGANAFLPALPGAELNLAAAQPIWRYRLAVPALDEAYSEAAESRDEAGRRPDLPVGFDPTRVAGAVAFAFTDTVARGWIHPTDEHTAGDLPLRLVGTPALAGRAPRLEIELKNHNGPGTLPIVFSRTENTAGATIPLVITPRTGAELPSFGVILGDTPGASDYVDHVRRNGQPLLAAVDPGAGPVVTHDGEGWIREQTAEPTQRSRRVGDERLITCLTTRAEVSPDLCLDLAAVRLKQGEESAFEGPRAQAWLLRSAAGTAPRIAGFALRPLKLDVLEQTATGLVARLEAILLPRDDVPPDARGEGIITLTLQQAAGSSSWSLAEVGGTIDWRFPAPAGELGAPRVIRLEATILPRPAGATDETFPLQIDRVDLEGPTGLLTVALERSGTLADGKLVVNDAAEPEPPPGFSAHLGRFTVAQGQAEPPEPSAFLSWSIGPTPAGDAARLSFRAGKWGFSLRRTLPTEVVTLVSTELEALPARLGTVLFRSASGGEATAMPAGSWFQRLAPDFALLGATFAAPDCLAELGGEILVRLKVEDGAAGLVGRLGVQLRIAGGAGLTIEPRVTGELMLKNQIGLRHEGVNWTHVITLTMDRADWTLEALFLGLGPAAPRNCPAVAAHRIHAGAAIIEWTVVQPVTLRTAADYASRFLGGGATSEALVVDAGWVFWLAELDPAEAADPTGLPHLEHPALGWQWLLAGRPAERQSFVDREAHIVRLPFANMGRGTALTLPQITIRMAAGEVSRVLPVPGAQMPEFAPAAIPEVPAAEAAFARRRQLAHWFDPAFLRLLFTSFDDDLLPAFGAADGTVSNRLPGSYGDLKWLAPDPATPPRRALVAASLRTPYFPLRAPFPLLSSTLLSFPFALERMDLAGLNDAGHVDAQLLAMMPGGLGRLKRERLELGFRKAEVVVPLWARQALDALRRDEGVLVLSDFGFVESAVAAIPRGPNAHRRERPRWPAAPIAGPGGGAQGQPPAADPDRRREPAGAIVLDASPIDALPVFAARPEPGLERPPDRAVAATRFRLAAEQRGVLRDARAEPLRLDSGSVLGEGRLVGLTRCDDVPFELGDARRRAWERYPLPGAEVFSLRDPLPDDWPGPDDGTARLTTVRPPLVDVVNWARRPGELTRTTWLGESFGYAPGHPRSIAAAAPREITLRRPRALAGPDEAVRLEVIRTRPLVLGMFQYARFRLTQRIARTPVPGITDVYAVLAGKAEIFPSARTKDEAATKPAMLRAGASTIEKASLTLIAEKLFTPRILFEDSSEERAVTVLIASTTGEIPDFDAIPPASVIHADLPPTDDPAWWSLGGDSRAFVAADLSALSAMLLPAPRRRLSC